LPRINHIAVWNSSEKNAYVFFRDIIGFEFLYEFHATQKVVEDIFELKEPMNILVFGNDETKIEVFINDIKLYSQHPINHICFDVEDVQDILEKTVKMNLPRRIIKRNNRNIVFIKDFDGNLFEIKNSAAERKE
jgi:catechol 2,3-dioxygenase-like lactoylglutathione lyase family enzyme